MSKEIDRQKLLDLMQIYKAHLEKELGAKLDDKPSKPTTREYQEFKAEFLPKHMTLYEKMCGLSERLLKIKPDEKRAAELQEAINITHLSITPSGTVSFSFLMPLAGALFGSLLAYLIFQSTFFVLLFVVGAVAAIKPLGRAPEFIANNWRLKASNQMVLCIFYVVTYMRHTSNLEKAIEFASQHLAPPLSLDMKKVLWDVETEKYSTVKESLDTYLDTWKRWNLEFIESFHLIESSLYEGDEARRLNALDKALDVILDETYEKMLHYAHNLQNPITMLHMLGIILPILGLVILPLVVSFMEGVRWYHLAFIYNVVLTVVVYYLGKNILSSHISPLQFALITLLGGAAVKRLQNASFVFRKQKRFRDRRPLRRGGTAASEKKADKAFNQGDRQGFFGWHFPPHYLVHNLLPLVFPRIVHRTAIEMDPKLFAIP